MILFRLTVFRDPRGPWRRTREEVQGDAIAANLATRDRDGSIWMPVPADIESREFTKADLPKEFREDVGITDILQSRP